MSSCRSIRNFQPEIPWQWSFQLRLFSIFQLSIPKRIKNLTCQVQVKSIQFEPSFLFWNLQGFLKNPKNSIRWLPKLWLDCWYWSFFVKNVQFSGWFLWQPCLFAQCSWFLILYQRFPSSLVPLLLPLHHRHWKVLPFKF